MIAKLVVWGPTRTLALNKLVQSLNNYQVITPLMLIYTAIHVHVRVHVRLGVPVNVCVTQELNMFTGTSSRNVHVLQ